MKKVKLVTLLAVVLLCSGCYTTGLSVRETGQYQYSNFIYGLYDQERADSPDGKLERPIKLAVAQVGETSPSQVVMTKLGQERHLISKLEELPVGGSINNYGYYSNESQSATLDEINSKMAKMRRIAKDLGVDYIFLYGGSADTVTTPSWTQMLDLTVVGMFIFPSQNIYMEGKASGALVHADSGKVLFVVSAEEKMKARATTVNLDGRKDEISVAMRDKLVASLSEKLVEKLNTAL